MLKYELFRGKIMEREILRAGYGEVVDYLQSDRRASVLMGFEMPYMLEVSLRGMSDSERLVILVDVLLNYKGTEVERILSLFQGYQNVIKNGRVCDIPLACFARLNSEEMANALLAMGCPDEKTEQSENVDIVKGTAELFGQVTSFADALKQDGLGIIQLMLPRK